MWSLFRKWFPFFFKNTDSEEEKKDQDQDVSHTDEPNSSKPPIPNEPKVKRFDLEGMFVLTLRRTEKAEDHSKGELLAEGKVLAQTLEGPVSGPLLSEKRAISVGDYLLGLRKEGGLHTSYGFRFGDLHKGMIQVKEVQFIDFVYFLMGNDASLSYGNILLGQDFKDDNLIRSEEAYRAVYEFVVGKLKDGEKLALRIES